MAEIIRMIEATRQDRLWFREQARLTRNHGMFIDAAACFIREKALRDALEAVKRERLTP